MCVNQTGLYSLLKSKLNFLFTLSSTRELYLKTKPNKKWGLIRSSLRRHLLLNLILHKYTAKTKKNYITVVSTRSYIHEWLLNRKYLTIIFYSSHWNSKYLNRQKQFFFLFLHTFFFSFLILILFNDIILHLKVAIDPGLTINQIKGSKCIYGPMVTCQKLIWI